MQKPIPKEGSPHAAVCPLSISKKVAANFQAFVSEKCIFYNIRKPPEKDA
jgi:hypothetical protein